MDSGINMSISDVFNDGFAPFLSNELFFPLHTTVMFITIAVAVASTCSNTVIIIVYRRLGFGDATNVSLTALAASDLVGSVTAILSCLCHVIAAIPNVPFTYEIFMFSVYTPHLMATRVSALITSYISVERYMCVLLPLKVKSLITPKRTSRAMVFLFVAGFIGWPIDCVVYPIHKSFFPILNRTMLRASLSTDPTMIKLREFNHIYYTFILPMSTFFIVLLCTILLSVSLQKSKAWRDENKSNTAIKGDVKKGAAKSKEARAVKLVMSIAIVFLISTILSSTFMVFVLIVPGFEIGGRYTNMYAVGGLMWLMVDNINYCANVFIYYKLSTKFKSTIRSLFSRKTEKSRI